MVGFRGAVLKQKGQTLLRAVEYGYQNVSKSPIYRCSFTLWYPLSTGPCKISNDLTLVSIVSHDIPLIHAKSHKHPWILWLNIPPSFLAYRHGLPGLPHALFHRSGAEGRCWDAHWIATEKVDVSDMIVSMAWFKIYIFYRETQCIIFLKVNVIKLDTCTESFGFCDQIEGFPVNCSWNQSSLFCRENDFLNPRILGNYM